MTFIECVPDAIASVIAIGFVLGVIMLPFAFVLVQQAITEKVAKRTYAEVLAKTTKLQPYLNQGYTLLAIVRQKGWFGAKFDVFDYPNRQAVNGLPLFKVDFEFATPSLIHTTGCATGGSAFVEQLPIKGIRELRSHDLYASLKIHFNKGEEAVLLATFPKPVLKDALKTKTLCTIESNLIPEGQTWQWQSNNWVVEDDQLIDTIHNRVLIATLPSVGGVSEVNYMVVHSEMPKALVAPFVHLSLLRSRSSSS